MRIKSISTVLCFAVVLSIALQGVLAGTAAAPTPLRGRGTGQITAVAPDPNGLAITAIGSGVSTHLGRFEREEHLALNSQTGQFTGTVVFTAANGDELWCSIEGGFTSQTTAAGSYSVTGGTGRFEGATGDAAFNVSQSDPVNFSFEFAGSIENN